MQLWHDFLSQVNEQVSDNVVVDYLANRLILWIVQIDPQHFSCHICEK